MREIGAAGFSEESLSAHLEPLRVERTLKSPRCVGFCACGNVMYLQQHGRIGAVSGINLCFNRPDREWVTAGDSGFKAVPSILYVPL